MKLQTFKEQIKGKKNLQATVISLECKNPYEYKTDGMTESLFDLLNKKPISPVVDKTVKYKFLFFFERERTITLPNKPALDIFAFADEYIGDFGSRYIVFDFPRRDVLYDSKKSVAKKYSVNGLVSAVRNKLKQINRVGVVINDYCYIISK